DDEEIRRLVQADRRDRSKVHQQRSVAVEHDDADVWPREREAESNRAREAHAAPRVEIPRPIAGGEQIVRRMTEARDDRRVAGEFNDDLRRVEPRHTDVVTSRGSRQAHVVRDTNDVVAARLTVSAASADSIVTCGIAMA